MKRLFIIALFFFATFPIHQNDQKVFYEEMEDGTFIIAINKQLAKDKQKAHHQLSKHFHLPPRQKHDELDVDIYPSLDDEVDIQGSPDSSILKKLKNVCLGGKNLKGRKKQQAFMQGICSPVVVVPGILATSLVISIDCQKLQKYDNGRIFKNCGWTSCSFVSLHRPDQEYLLWVGLQLMLKVTKGHTRCFGDLFGLLYDVKSKSDDFGSRYSFPAGIKSTWIGNDPYTDKASNCGVNAIRDLNGYVSLLSIMGSQCALKDYGRLLDMLMVMGYQPGLTLQPLPYDFRYGILASSTPKLFPQIINNLYYTSGKKVVVVAHSLGTLHTLENLAFMVSEEDKQKMVRHYIPITPPWFGTVSGIRNVLYGDPSYFTSGFLSTGINKYAQMKFSVRAGSTYDLFLRDAFHTYRQQPWLQEILKRIEYEKQPATDKEKQENKDDEDYPMNWYPSKTELCFDPRFKKNPYCETGFIDFEKTPIFTIRNKNYYGNFDSMRQLLQDNIKKEYIKTALSLWDQTKIKNKTLNEIPAPGVDTSMIFTTLFDTQIYYKYNKRPKQDKGDDNSFIEAIQMKTCPGDISVPSFSPLIYLAKWIHDGTNGDHDVQAVQYCGKYEGKKKKHYSTMSCECYQNPFKNPLDCTHPCIISDKFLIEFVISILTNDTEGYDDEPLGDAVYFSTKQLDKRQRKCDNLHPHNLIVPSQEKQK